MFNSNKLNAFSLIELLIYVSIFSVVSGLIVGITASVIRVQQRETAANEATSQLNFLTQTISRLVRESSAIIVNSSSTDVSNDAMTGTSQSRLVLRMQDSTTNSPTDRDPIIIWNSSGTIKMSEGTSTPRISNLTNSQVVVDKLEFTKFSQYPGHDTVSVNIQVSASSTNPNSKNQRTLSFAVARVSAATFDADLLPGTGNTYDIGSFSGTGWRRILMNDGTSQNPSYTFTNSPNTGIFSRGTDLINFSTAQSERMVIDNNGNIGIGTTTPEVKLQVQESATNSTAIRVGDGTSRLNFIPNLGAGGFNPLSQIGDIGLIFTDGTQNTGNLVIGPVSPYEAGIRITNTGSVGIGTTNPWTKFDVNSGYGKVDTVWRNLFAWSSNDATNKFVLQGAMKGEATQANRGVMFQTVESGVANDGFISFQPNGGNVGIGTTTPQAKLDVNGKVRSDNSLKTYVGTTTATYNGSGVGGYSGGDAKCAAEFGAGSRMAYAGDFINGIPNAEGWFNKFVRTNNYSGCSGNDCQGWTTNLAGWCGEIWDLSLGTNGSATQSTCNLTRAILCVK